MYLNPAGDSLGIWGKILCEFTLLQNFEVWHIRANATHEKSRKGWKWGTKAWSPGKEKRWPRTTSALDSGLKTHKRS